MTVLLQLGSIKRNLQLLRQELERTKSTYWSRKFDPDQPRVPAGNPDGGRWTSNGAPGEDTNDPAAGVVLAATSPLSASFCWNQMQIDMLLCASLIPPWRVAACRAQANERYAACLTGKPIPPLPF